MKRIIRRAWMQAVPRTYWTSYGQEVVPGSGDFKPHFTIWKMWLGRCYNVIDVPVAS